MKTNRRKLEPVGRAHNTPKKRTHLPRPFQTERNFTLRAHSLSLSLSLTHTHTHICLLKNNNNNNNNKKKHPQTTKQTANVTFPRSKWHCRQMLSQTAEESKRAPNPHRAAPWKTYSGVTTGIMIGSKPHHHQARQACPCAWRDEGSQDQAGPAFAVRQQWTGSPHVVGCMQQLYVPVSYESRRPQPRGCHMRFACALFASLLRVLNILTGARRHRR